MRDYSVFSKPPEIDNNVPVRGVDLMRLSNVCSIVSDVLRIRNRGPRSACRGEAPSRSREPRRQRLEVGPGTGRTLYTRPRSGSRRRARACIDYSLGFGSSDRPSNRRNCDRRHDEAALIARPGDGIRDGRVARVVNVVASISDIRRARRRIRSFAAGAIATERAARIAIPGHILEVVLIAIRVIRVPAQRRTRDL